MKDIRQSNAYAEYLARIGWTVQRTNGEYVYVKKIPLLGSIVKLQRTNNMQLADLERIAVKNRAYQTIVEPVKQDGAEILKAKDYKLSSQPYLVTKTLHIDIKKDIQQIYEGMKKRTRREIRKTSHINTYEINNIKQFHEAWEKSINYNKTLPPIEHIHALKHSFKNNCCILVTPNASSGAIFLYANNVGYYWHAFSNKQGRKKKLNTKILWSGINWAKQKGAKLFDMEGIYDKRFPVKSWRGFSKFKQGFGGVEVEYPGAFVKKRLPI
jgi:lipid II:glycine glycyltransferase (peptidoglycan interpeptide bridge formation enzyme)